MTDELLDHTELLLALAQFEADPIGFVYFAYPWGQGELKKYSGPDDWQLELLQQITEGVLAVQDAIAIAQAREEEAETKPMLFATTSGHGIGKSAFVAWLIDWAMSTMEDTKGVVTANTENQLKTKTWAELAKWHRLSVTKDLFKMTATSRFSVDPDHEKTWRVDMSPWSEKNTEAFAGMHNHGKRIIVVFDEASAIPDIIWTVTEGALTDKETQIIWAVFGNPTKNTGRFRECFAGGKFEHRWSSRAIDSRTVAITNKSQIQDWIDDYGEDHDFVRVRVRGIFPRVDATSFISYEEVQEAIKRPLPPENYARWIIGVDVARFGPDSSVVFFRRGLDARSRAPRRYQGKNSIQLASLVYDAFMETEAIAVFVDVGGVGSGVVDQLETLGVPVYPVDFGSGPDHIPTGEKFLNKRAEIYAAARDFIRKGGCIGDFPAGDTTFAEQATASTYTYARGDTVLQIESKKDMKRRGIASPDDFDAFATTFAYPFLTTAPAVIGSEREKQQLHYEDINPYA